MDLSLLYYVQSRGFTVRRAFSVKLYSGELLCNYLLNLVCCLEPNAVLFAVAMFSICLRTLFYGNIDFNLVGYFSTQMDNALIDDRRIHVDFSQSVAKLWSQYKGKGRMGGGNGLSSPFYFCWWSVVFS